MKPKIESDVMSESPAAEPANPEADLESYDASQQQFAASRDGGVPEETAGLALETSPADPSVENPETWRQEVAARLNRYRARRRPRAPHYPSLRLKFEAGESAPSATPFTEPATSRTAVAVETSFSPTAQLLARETRADAVPSGVEESARIIPFPRSAIVPPRPLEELAGPVMTRPRILEAPEVAPPPPALGGILIEPAEEPVEQRRPGIELPLQSAALWRRLLAGGIDGVLVASASALFAYLFFRITMTIPPLRQTAPMAISLCGAFWAAYQYLLLVNAGTTPGLKLAKLRLSRFDGSAVPRRTRRWRVLASVLSAVSLGLGYAWCILDEDELCWHDRITGTHLAPVGSNFRTLRTENQEL